MKALNYTSIAMLEYKYNFETDEWIFIEINARFWGSLPLAVAAGANFPYFLFQMLLDHKKEFRQKYNENLFCRNFIMDFNWFLANLKHDKTDKTKETVPLWKVFTEIRNIILFRERSDTFVLDDMMPGFREVSSFIGSKWNRIRSKALTLGYTKTTLCKQRDVRKLSDLRKGANNILFVCKGNICRSPFAEFDLKVKSDAFHVTSAGYFPKSNRLTPDNGVAAANDLSALDLQVHRSKIINHEMVIRNDIIFVFDVQNMIEVTSRFPEAKHKTFFLGVLGEGGKVFIEDPYGKSIDEFKHTYQRIGGAIDHFIALGQ